jgi:hypothetical protein
MSKIGLHKDDIREIQKLLDSFPDAADYIEIEVDSSSGIGFIVTVIMKTTVNGHFGEFRKAIVDASSW